MTRGRASRVFLAVAIILLIGLFEWPQVAAQSRDYSKFIFRAGAGLSIPLGDLGSDTNFGYAATVGGGYNFSKRASLIAEYMFDRFRMDDSILNSIQAGAPGATDVSGAPKVWSLTGNGIFRANRTGKVSLYGIAGAGIYQRKYRFNITYAPVPPSTIPSYSSLSQISTAFGINFGGGAEFDFLKGLKGFIEARYHIAFTDSSTQLIPITFGVRW